MVTNIWVQASAPITMIMQPLHVPASSHPNSGPYLPTRLLRKRVQVKASSTNDSNESTSAPKRKSIFSVVLGVPRIMWERTLQPLSDFGFGRRSIWEGGVGLFVVSGVALFALSLAWLRAFHIRSRFKKYQAVFEFTQACGICVGTPVRIRGVTVGSVVKVDSSLKSIDAVVEVEDDKTIIPRNSLVEVNQSGLLMETLIDITPKDPLPEPTLGPLDPDCSKEGLIVCDRERMKGREGVSLDALVGIFTRLGREMEEISIKRSYALAEKVALIVQEAQPLISKIELMMEDIQPLLVEVRDSALLKDVESLTKSLTEATEDLREALLEEINDEC